jgi:hypothetical protein
MTTRVCLVGLDEPEHAAITARLRVPVLVHETLPKILVQDGRLLVEAHRGGYLAVARMVFHAIFEDDVDFLAALALWGGPCLPGALGMMDCRLRLPGLVRALRHTRFGAPPRGYAAPGAAFQAPGEWVAKWGNWHCGENKARFTGEWTSADPCLIEPFFAGQAVRVLVIGDRHWQIRLEGAGWLKSLHAADADLIPVDEELLADTRAVGRALGLELLANDYIVTPEGTRHLLEVNHVPNVTRFPEVWEAYRDFVAQWVAAG